MAADLRIGLGYDIHQLIAGRKLVIGGVEIPHEQGLLGHSDADVLLHALTDALLGALGWGDIGTWFPNTDARFAGAASRFFVETVWKKAAAEGWRVVNVDAVVLAERPRLQPYIDEMRAVIASLIGITRERVSIKATTTEKLGPTGREEGIAAHAVALLER
jgi:2-C-methyl-D-erythritol 2,4-cyclodiphosphate synthase